MKNKKVRNALTLALVIFGVLFVSQFKTQQIKASSLEMQSTEDLIAIWRDQNLRNQELTETLEQLKEEALHLEQEMLKGSGNLERLQNENLNLRMVTGDTAVTGEGITITFTSEIPLFYLDLVDLANELWISGAEAIAINDQRLTSFTPIYMAQDPEKGMLLTVDNQILFYPIVVKAIGDPSTLEKGLTFSGGIIDMFRQYYGAIPLIKQEKKIDIPAVAPPVLNYAKPSPASNSTS